MYLCYVYEDQNNYDLELTKLFNSMLEVVKAVVKDEVMDEVMDEVTELIVSQKQGYTIKEFSTITGITINGVKGRIKRGTLRAFKDANTYIIHKDEVNRFVAMIKNAS